MTESELKNLGYEVVPFFLTHDVWNQARDYMQTFQANGVTPEVFKDMLDSGEDVMPEITAEMKRYKQSSWSKFFTTWFDEQRGQGRRALNFRAASVVSDKKFEQVLKRREQFARTVSQKW